jgi:RNA polymerase sigma-70 factor (ECF subfamily)
MKHRLAEARAAWPRVTVDEAAFQSFLARRALPDEHMHVADLYLAFAASQGDEVAIAAVEDMFIVPLRRTMASLRLGPAALDDLRQALHVLLFVAQGKIATYDGRGSLRSWLRVVVVREAMHFARIERRSALSSDALDDFPAIGDDPELAHLKRIYKDEFAKAFAAAVSNLSFRQQNVLRQSVTFGLNVDRIGALYNVHRATVARWLDDARETLLVETRRELAGRLQLSDREIDSLLRCIESQLEVSVNRLLAEHVP